MIDVWIVTHHFPCEPGEQFLEEEIKFWVKQQQARVTLLPILPGTVSRPLPQEIAVDYCLSQESSRLFRKIKAIRAIFSRRLWKELFWLQKMKMLSAGTFISAWRSEAMILRICARLRWKIARTKDRVIAYSYWFDVGAYALAALRREGVVDYVVTRAHGFDLYEERQPNSYMPLRRQFVRDFDQIFAVSEQGRKYLYDRFSIPENLLSTARLGVLTENKLSLCSSATTYNIVSVSFCVSVKRIDRIIEGIAIAAQKIDKNVLVSWTHIGDGELKDMLESKAVRAFMFISNVRFNFLGHLQNADVMNYYKINKVDVFINTSESEGLPISIMEAMSYGIPAIAPAVGGIPELINQENGWLLSGQPCVDQIARALIAVQHYKSEQTRQAARQTIFKNYNSEVNYKTFISNFINKSNEY